MIFSDRQRRVNGIKAGPHPYQHHLLECGMQEDLEASG